MIEFNEHDVNLPSIRRESKLANLVTRFKYRVYGLRQEDNPPVLIEYNVNNVDNKFNEKLNVLSVFLKGNGIEVDVYNELEQRMITVGLRRDLREFLNKSKKPMLASSVLSTIIYCLEGRIDLKQLKKFKLSTIPNFVPSPTRA